MTSAAFVQPPMRYADTVARLVAAITSGGHRDDERLLGVATGGRAGLADAEQNDHQEHTDQQAKPGGRHPITPA